MTLRRILCAALALLCLQSDVSAEDYCRLPCMGDHGRNHVGCRNSGFGASCGSSPQTAELDASHIKRVLQEVNWLRATIAEGSFCYPKAVRMPVLVWDAELAHLAELHSKGCVLETKKCRRTERFHSPAQNSFLMSSQTMPPTMDVIHFATRDWYLQKDNLTEADIRNYPSGNDRGLKNLANLISDKVTAIGCGLTHWQEGQSTKSLFTCNLSSSNVPGLPIYKAGDKYAAKCAKAHPYYYSLCTSDERVRPNK